MKNFILSCCSTADLSKEYLQQRDIHYVCFHYEIDGQHYLDDLGETMSMETFYHAMANGALTRTSQVNVQEYTEHFRQILKTGNDILHLTLSSGISGTLNSARIAAEALRDEFPRQTIVIIDSFGASSGYGLLLDKIADLRDEGMGLEETRQWVEENRLSLHHWFISTDLSAYIRGGRISKAAGLIGSALSICPLMNMDAAGKLTIVSKIRTKKKAFRELVQRMQQHAQNGLNYDGKCFISHSDCLNEARLVAAAIEETFQKLNGSVRIFNVGATIGSHTGSGTIALFFWGDPRN